MSYRVSEVWSKTAHERVGYLDELGNRCSRPLLHYYFKGKTNQTHREGNYTETQHLRNQVKCICTGYSGMTNQTNGFGYNINAGKANPADHWK